MEFSELLEIVKNESVFETSLLLAGDVSSADVRRGLSRWKQAGKIYQLRRGVYTLAPPYQKFKPHPFAVANQMVQASYVSLQSALAYYALIPEATLITTSVTTRKPGRWDTPLGLFDFHHIQIEFFDGFQMVDLGGSQRAFIASPEKALLDLIYLTPGGDEYDYLAELRLQNLEQLNWDNLNQLVERMDKPKLGRATAVIRDLSKTEAEFTSL